MTPQQLKNILEAALLAEDKPLSIDRMLSLFTDDEKPGRDDMRAALTSLQDDCAERGIELKEISSGYRLQVKKEYGDWVSRLWEEKPPRYSRALLETLALIAYRQPITRAEIEDVRGVSVSSNIVKTLQERDWIRVLGHRDVPGKPALYGTTRTFLDYFNLKSLDDLPTLAEIKDLDELQGALLGDETDTESEQASATGTQQRDMADENTVATSTDEIDLATATSVDEQPEAAIAEESETDLEPVAETDNDDAEEHTATVTDGEERETIAEAAELSGAEETTAASHEGVEETNAEAPTAVNDQVTTTRQASAAENQSAHADQPIDLTRPRPRRRPQDKQHAEHEGDTEDESINNEVDGVADVKSTLSAGR
jgi:segregation and condensation protein B